MGYVISTWHGFIKLLSNMCLYVREGWGGGWGRYFKYIVSSCDMIPMSISFRYHGRLAIRSDPNTWTADDVCLCLKDLGIGDDVSLYCKPQIITVVLKMVPSSYGGATVVAAAINHSRTRHGHRRQCYGPPGDTTDFTVVLRTHFKDYPRLTKDHALDRCSRTARQF